MQLQKISIIFLLTQALTRRNERTEVFLIGTTTDRLSSNPSTKIKLISSLFLTQDLAHIGMNGLILLE